MSRSSIVSRNVLALAAALALVALLIMVAGGALGRGVEPSPERSPAPSVAPSVQPSALPTASPTLKPTDGPSDGPFKVDLENLTGDDVSVVIDDETGTLTGAASGIPGDGMSVRWFDVQVENLDAETVRVTWVGLPRDEELTLAITGESGSYQLLLVQAAPPANSDALGFDRVLDLRFESPVSAADVHVTVEETPAGD
ncbi:MAG TPA: hypothetical protein VM408_02145 [Methylomirabilota bacterium]|nr:hypothetical protein [Methylomirabilota bacterium]